MKSQQAIINAQHKKTPLCVVCHKHKGVRTIHGEWVCGLCRMTKDEEITTLQEIRTMLVRMWRNPASYGLNPVDLGWLDERIKKLGKIIDKQIEGKDNG